MCFIRWSIRPADTIKDLIEAHQIQPHASTSNRLREKAACQHIFHFPRSVQELIYTASVITEAGLFLAAFITLFPPVAR